MVKYIEIDGIGEVVPRSEYDALAAQAEALKLSDSGLHALVEDLIGHLRYNNRESTDVIETYWDRLSAIQTTQISPQHHLREVRAEAVLDFHHAWSQQTRVNSLAQFANQYADSILKGGAE